MFDLKRYLDGRAAQVNAALEHLLPGSGPSERIMAAMRYSLMAGGKRLRPVLCLAASEAVGGRPEAAVSTACAIEMIHTYSLIHDDLPAMDDDRLRRGLPTCHVAFDEATAILAGDALLTAAFETLSVAAAEAPRPELWIDNMTEIARAAGCQGMIAGQMQDMEAEGNRLTADQLEAMHLLKTGALIRVSIRCGARIGNATVGQLDALTAFAEHLGLAFQVTDDILNVEGDPSEMGKAAGTDRERDKNAYPSLLGLEQSKLMARRLIDSALEKLEIFERRGGEPLRAIARYVVDRKR